VISLDKCKSVNNAPNILMRSGSRWTHGAQAKGLKHKGLEYLYFDCDLGLYNKAKIFGGNDFWDKNDGENMTKFADREKELKAWIDTEERKLNAQIVNRVMGR